MQTPPVSFDRVTKLLHWSIAVAIIAIAGAELLREELLPKGSFLREGLKALHNPAGTIVLALVLLRLVWRSIHAAPRMPGSMRPWEKLLANLTHYALYAAMLLIPLSGIAYTFARGRSIDFGVIEISYPLDRVIGRGASGAIKGLHEFLGQAVLVLAFVHAAAALWHHYVRRDDVLTRMLPTRGPSQGR